MTEEGSQPPGAASLDMSSGIRAFLLGCLPAHEGDTDPRPVPGPIQAAILERLAALSHHERTGIAVSYMKVLPGYVRVHLSVAGHGNAVIGGCDVTRRNDVPQDEAMSYARGLALLDALEQLARASATV